MLHECRRWTSRHPRDLAARAHRVSIGCARDPLQPAEDDRGFLEPAASWRRRLLVYRPNARILSLIAATALEHQLVLVTRNARDFQTARGLKLRHPGP